MQIDDTAKKEVEDPDTDTEFPNIFKETNQLTADQKEEIKKFMRGQYQMEEGKIVNIIMNQVESTFEGNPVFVRVNMELNFQACRWRKTTSRVRIR